MMKRLLLFLILMAARETRGGMVISNETLFPALTSDAYYMLTIPFAPGDGAVVYYNPPVFKWPYAENTTVMAAVPGEVRNFQFQLSTNAGGTFASLYWNIACSNNFYNLLPPITNADGTHYAGPNYWRIIFSNSNRTVNVFTSATHSFTLAATATNWDRSMLADTNYLLSKVTNHPHMWFVQTNIAAVGTFVRTNLLPNTGQGYNQITNAAASWQAQSWWNSNTITNLDSGSILAVDDGAQVVALAYYMSGSNAAWDISGACGTYDWFATRYRQLNRDQQNPYAIDVGGVYKIAHAYDWLYPFMTTAQRSNTLALVVSIAKFCAYNDYFGFVMPDETGQRAYTNGMYVHTASSSKQNSSHERFDGNVAMEMCIAAMGESPDLLYLFPWFISHDIAQFDPYQGDEGRAYSEQGNFKFDRMFAASALATVQFPEAQLWRSPIYTNLASFYAQWEPVGFRNGAPDNWASEYGFVSQWFNTRYYDLALITGNGAVLRQYNRSYQFKLSGADVALVIGEAFLPFYYPTPAEADWPSSTYVDPVRGWIMSSMYPPSDYGAFTNGVGFVLQGRPQGTRLEHSSVTDGQVELWAYGATCTSAGVASGYSKAPFFYNGLLVNGIGVNNPLIPTDPVYSYLLAFTNTAAVSFAAVDITKAFNRSNYNSSGLDSVYSSFYNNWSNTVPQVSEVRRYVLFPHKKYLVLYDVLQTTTNSTFQWLWHLWETNHAVVNVPGCFFSYGCTNVYSGSNVTVYVNHVVDPTTMTLTYLTGTNLSKTNIVTGEDYFASSANLDGGPYTQGVIFVQNKTATTNWHFMAVIFPKRWDDATPPTFTHPDDNTVTVAFNDGSGIIDTNTFGNGYAGPSTFLVNLADVGGTNPPSVIQNYHVGRMRAATVRAGAVTIGP